MVILIEAIWRLSIGITHGASEKKLLERNDFERCFNNRNLNNLVDVF